MECLQSLVEQCPADDPDTEINVACLLYKVKIYIKFNIHSSICCFQYDIFSLFKFKVC